MYQQYKDGVEFYVVYIREAHPTNGWQVPANVRDNVLLAAAATEEQKHENGAACARNLGIEFPTLVDGMDNRAEQDYTAWPDRLYLVDRDGKIAYKSGPGPMGFKPPELEAAIHRLR